MQFRLTFSLTGCGLWDSPLNKNNDNRQNNSSVRWRENYRRTGISFQKTRIICASKINIGDYLDELHKMVRQYNKVKIHLQNNKEKKL